ncbi:hypothetical protein M2227_003451 [Bradyrhizobium elkanii]|uniref:hypothetical protein n=1 Tax=Bradyrhizobium elkanii TaxID=29448 RepID=UPI0022261158|nr:hypothetical protein [Bradyrhizobium elkanii]MCW2110265.1 hypothetical protein [Bradyrhizobium elkanii]MCW2201361.1 hypothetical protein [Bradyrhizobium elkanii]MCW2226988.1 hypothetical protein [Bradyrhizobium elkanii]WLB76434.1 hypothetical protein QIH89_22085 [Bradyrhizobium elkanii]
MTRAALSCQINAIGDHLTGVAGLTMTLRELRMLSSALQQQIRRIEEIIEQRIERHSDEGGAA